MNTTESNKSAEENGGQRRKTPLWTKLLTVVVLVVVGVVAASLLPRGYSEDITLIGKGGNVLVLLQEPFTVDGQENMDAMNAVRSEYEGRLTFVVADKKVEQGKKFSELYGINSTAFVLFAPNGEKLGVVYGALSADELKKILDTTYPL